MSGSVLILVVEDEDLISEFIQDTLEDGGFGVLVARSGIAALEAIDTRIGDIAGIVTDIRLTPNDPDGWAIARHAREAKADIPIIYMSGDSAADWSAHGVPKSVILQKPFAAAQLITAISNLLNEGDGGVS